MLTIIPLTAEEWRERCRKIDAELALDEDKESEEENEDIEEAKRMEALVFESRWYNSR